MNTLWWSLWLYVVRPVTFVVAILIVSRHVWISHRRLAGRAKLGIAASDKDETRVIAFYHPFCASGGGGERVLWKMIHTLASMHARGGVKFHVVIYAAEASSSSLSSTAAKADRCGDENDRPSKVKASILRGAEERFGIKLSGGSAGSDDDVFARTEKKDEEVDGPVMPIDFVFVPRKTVGLAQPEAWPRFTMVGQSVGACLVALHGLCEVAPDAYVDTTGAAFTLPLAKLLFGCRTGCYVHYPTVSTDMLQMVYEQRSSYNNAGAAAGSKAGSWVKLVYYSLFALCYSAAGSWCDLVLVNSSWTEGHIASLWFSFKRPKVLFPPCGVGEFRRAGAEKDGHGGNEVQRLGGGGSNQERGTVLATKATKVKTAAAGEKRRRYVVSVGQFRPEKDHALQLRAFTACGALRAKHKKADQQSDDGAGDGDGDDDGVRLVLLGSCRGPGDEARVSELRGLACELGVAPLVHFALNLPFKDPASPPPTSRASDRGGGTQGDGNGGDELLPRSVVGWLQTAEVGVHTMWNEHFGIGVVEMMAAGLVVVAHDSGGPALDIVTPCFQGESSGDPQWVGFRARDQASFSLALAKALDLDPIERSEVVARAVAKSERFSDDAFAATLTSVVNHDTTGLFFSKAGMAAAATKTGRNATTNEERNHKLGAAAATQVGLKKE